MIPGTAAKYAFCAITLPTGVRPLPDVSHHIVQAKSIWLEAAYRRGFSVVPLAPAPIAVSIITPDVIAPIVVSGGASARSDLPFFLAWQAIIFSGLTRQPLNIGLCVIPAYIDYGSFAASPTIIQRLVSATAAIRYTGVPFIKRYRELTDGKLTAGNGY